MSLIPSITTDDDRDLSERVVLFLSGRKHPAVRNLEVTSDRGTVVLRGQVHSFYHRQLALEFARRVAGVVQLQDELLVDDSSASTVPPTRSNHLPPIDLAELSPRPQSSITLA